MKVTIHIKCTPEEARSFFGLPEVKPVQERLLKELEAQMKANMAAMDLETLYRTILPEGIKGFEALQKSFWQELSKAMGGTASEGAKKKGGR